MGFSQNLANIRSRWTWMWGGSPASLLKKNSRYGPDRKTVGDMAQVYHLAQAAVAGDLPQGVEVPFIPSRCAQPTCRRITV